MPEDLEGKKSLHVVLGKVGCGLAEIGVKSKIKSAHAACELTNNSLCLAQLSPIVLSTLLGHDPR